jgi:hypothetical protein
VLLQFGQPASAEIQQYLQKAIEPVLQGPGALLVNLRQLRITNRTLFIAKPGEKHGKKRYDLRYCVLLTADLYDKKGDGLYYPLLRIRNVYPVKGPVISALADALDDVLRAAGARSARSNATYQYIKSAAGQTLEQINVNVRESWDQYPVMAVSSPASGVFMQFEDFRNNKPRRNNFHASYRSRDSVYILSHRHSRGHHITYPWGFADQGNLYVNLYANLYVKASRYDHTYRFYVPRGIPDMYSLLSIETGASSNGINDPNPMTNNLTLRGALSGIAVLAMADVALSGSKLLKIRKAGIKSGFRYCYLDMDTGDVIYAETLAQNIQ